MVTGPNDRGPLTGLVAHSVITALSTIALAPSLRNQIGRPSDIQAGGKAWKVATTARPARNAAGPTTGHQRFVNVEDVEFGGDRFRICRANVHGQRPSGTTEPIGLDRSDSSYLDRAIRGIGHSSGAGTDDCDGLLAAASNRRDSSRTWLLDSAVPRQVVGADQADPHEVHAWTRSDGQFGCRRCHCSGAWRINRLESLAIAWVTFCDVSRPSIGTRASRIN